MHPVITVFLTGEYLFTGALEHNIRSSTPQHLSVLSSIQRQQVCVSVIDYGIIITDYW